MSRKSHWSVEKHDVGLFSEAADDLKKPWVLLRHWYSMFGEPQSAVVKRFPTYAEAESEMFKRVRSQQRRARK